MADSLVRPRTKLTRLCTLSYTPISKKKGRDVLLRSAECRLTLTSVWWALPHTSTNAIGSPRLTLKNRVGAPPLLSPPSGEASGPQGLSHSADMAEVSAPVPYLILAYEPVHSITG